MLDLEDLRPDEAERVTRRGSWEWDVATDRAVWSKGMYHLFGVDPATFSNTNKNFLTLVHPEDRERMQAAMAAVLARPGPFLQEYRLRRPDGVMLHILSEGNVVQDAGGKPRLLYGFVQDITDRKNAERLALELARRESERLAQLSATKTTVLNMVAHDLNNIVTPMRLSLRTIQEAVKGREEAILDGAMRSLDRSVDRVVEFLADLLDVARLESHALRVAPVRMDLSAHLESAVRIAKAEAEARSISVEADVPLGVDVHADLNRIDQVTRNLISNALKYTPDGGHVRVALVRRPHEVQVDVRNTGAGIAAADLPKLFQPFSQVGKQAQGRHTGTGLGLFICKGIVEAHGGKIWCESQKGAGTAFSFTLPAGLPA